MEEVIGINKEIFLEVFSITVAFFDRDFIQVFCEAEGIELGFFGNAPHHLVHVSEITDPESVFGLVTCFNHIHEVGIASSRFNPVAACIEEPVKAFIFGNRGK